MARENMLLIRFSDQEWRLLSDALKEHDRITRALLGTDHLWHPVTATEFARSLILKAARDYAESAKT